jgi:rhomboid family GlyGly-CTERM serine protease
VTQPERSAAFGLPVVTLVLLLFALLLQLAPLLAGSLSFEREAIERGEVWRLLTGHLVHGPPRLALFDLTGLALLGACVERASRRLLVRVLAASAAASSLAVYFLTPYAHYVGSSALVSGLLVALLVHWLRSSRRPARILAWTMLLIYSSKLVLELLGAWPDALTALSAGDGPIYETAAMAHAAGALAGGAVTLLTRA